MTPPPCPKAAAPSSIQMKRSTLFGCLPNARYLSVPNCAPRPMGEGFGHARLKLAKFSSSAGGLHSLEMGPRTPTIASGVRVQERKKWVVIPCPQMGFLLSF